MKLQEDTSSDSFIWVIHLNYSIFSCALLFFSYHLVFQREVCSLMEVEIHSLTAYTFLAQAFRSRRKEKANKFSIYYSFTLIWKSNHTGKEDLKLVITAAYSCLLCMFLAAPSSLLIQWPCLFSGTVCLFKASCNYTSDLCPTYSIRSSMVAITCMSSSVWCISQRC